MGTVTHTSAICSKAPPSKPLNEAEIGELREILVGFGWPVAEPAAGAVAAG